MKKLFLVPTIVFLAACSGSRDAAQPTPQKSDRPQSPVPAQTTQAPEFVIEKKREKESQEVLLHNRDLSKMNARIVVGNLQGIVSAFLQVTKLDEGKVGDVKFSLIVKENDEVKPESFLLNSALQKAGGYALLPPREKSSKSHVEARCLDSCDHILVRFRRAAQGEIALVFKLSERKSTVGELLMIPGFERHPEQARILANNRIIELSYQIAEELEFANKKLMIAKQLVDVSQKAEVVDVAVRQVLTLTQEVYNLSRMTLTNEQVTWDVPANKPQQIQQTIENLQKDITAMTSKFVVNLSETQNKDKANQEQLSKVLNDASQAINQSQSKLPRLLSLIGKANQKHVAVN